MGPKRNFKEFPIHASLSVKRGARWIGRGGILPSGMPMDSGLPVMASFPPWRNILTSSGMAILSIRIGIYAFASGGRNIRGGADDDDA